MTYQPPPPTAPIPVAPLQWPEAPPVRRGKPGLITAMGIISIIVACMSGFANFVLTFVAVAMLAGSRGPAVWTPPAPPVQVAPVGPNGATAVVGGLEVDPSQSEDGIHDENLRPMVIAGMTRARALDDGRRKQLDLLLMVAGRSIFPFISPGTQPQTIRANVSDSGRLPSAAAGKKGPDYFIVGTGRVEVYDTHAIFRPDGSPNVVSVSVPTGDGSADGSANAPGQPPPATTVPPPPPPMVNPMASLNKTAATVSMIEAIIAMLVAVYLLIIGIVTLRDSRAGGRLHWIYVAVKIPLAIVMVVAYSMVASSLVAGANAAAAATPGAPAVAAGMGAMATFWVVMLGLAAFAYPLALVPVLLTKTVRKYYSPARYD